MPVHRRMIDRISGHESSLSARLDRYVDELSSCDARWTGDLESGCDVAEVGALLREYVARPLPELVELWCWRNGQHHSTQQPLFWDIGFFRGIDVANIGMFRDFAKDTQLTAKAEGYFWPEVSDAIPILFSWGGSWVWVDSGEGADRGYVFSANPHDLGPAQRLFPSLETAVGVAHSMVQTGLWRVGADLWIRDVRYDADPGPASKR